jgi:hypothetical protein
MAGDVISSPSATVKVFACPSCSASVTLRNSQGSVTVVCASCGSIIDVTNENLNIIAKVKQKTKREPLIPLGERGKLHGVLWEVIGFMERRDANSPFYWEEYLLFNPYHGYRWLTQSNGHWNYVVMSKQKPKIAGSGGTYSINYMGKHYQLFFKGQAEVVYVIGEFYWRVKVGDRVSVKDFICPPEILSQEKDDGEEVWSIGEYTEPEQIRKAFKVTRNFPPKVGIAPNQPSEMSGQMLPMFYTWCVFALLLLCIQIFHIVTSKNEIAFQHTYTYSQQDKQHFIVSEPFQLTGGTGNVKIDLDAMVDNAWLSVDGDLVDEKTGKTYPFDQTVEYYHGYTDGESWSEGGHSKERLLSSIPDGTYHLNMELSAPGNWDGSAYTKPFNEMPFIVTVYRKVTTLANFFWIFLFISIFPVIAFFKASSFELGRWADSDYSPYPQITEEED